MSPMIHSNLKMYHMNIKTNLTLLTLMKFIHDVTIEFSEKSSKIFGL